MAVDIYGWQGDDYDDQVDKSLIPFEKLNDRNVYCQIQFEPREIDTGVGEKESCVGYVFFRNKDLIRAGITLKRNFQLIINEQTYRIVFIEPAAVLWKKPLMSRCYVNEALQTGELREARLSGN